MFSFIKVCRKPCPSTQRPPTEAQAQVTERQSRTHRYRVMTCTCHMCMYRVLRTSLTHCTHHDNAIYTHARHTLTLSHLHTLAHAVRHHASASAGRLSGPPAYRYRPALSPSPIAQPYHRLALSPRAVTPRALRVGHGLVHARREVRVLVALAPA